MQRCPAVLLAFSSCLSLLRATFHFLRVRTGLLRTDVELTYLLRSSGPLAGLVRDSEHIAIHVELPADGGFPQSDPRWQAASK